MISDLCLALLLVITLAQGGVQIPSDFASLQQMSIEELKLKTEGHAKVWGLDRIERWDLNQDSGQLVFSLQMI